MPKKQPPKSPVQKIKAFWLKQTRRNKVIFILIFGILLLWISHAVIHQIRVHYERAQYNRAIIDLNTLYDEIAAKVGKADEVKDTQSCGYVNIKYARGPRYCDIDKYFVYEEISRAQAVSRSQSIVNAIQRSHTATFSTRLPDTAVADEMKGFNTVEFSLDGLEKCSTSFLYINQATTLDYSLKSFGGYINRPGLSVRLHCSGGDQTEYFPVVN
jgi:hypothetical protein